MPRASSASSNIEPLVRPAAEPATDKARSRQGLLRRLAARRAVLVAAVAAMAAAGGVVALRAAPSSVSTDNAYLKSDPTTVAPRVRGLVAQVLAADNELVEAGQPLVRLDPEEYAARVSAAEGDLALADAQVESARSALVSVDAQQALAQDGVRQARSDIAASEAQAVRAQADSVRFQKLADVGTAPRRDAERMHADAVSAQAAVERAHAALSVSQDQVAVVAGRRAELAAAVLAAQAAAAKARAALELAQQDAEHAVIRAPVAGVVGNRQVNAGDYVQPGTRLLTLMPAGDLYITANFKETQTARLTAGQPAQVRIDALPGVTLKAHVQSFAPGSGSEFALLPFEPGSGNFTKIVQRVPVRLAFDPGQPALARLRPGLSAKVSVRLIDPARPNA